MRGSNLPLPLSGRTPRSATPFALLPVLAAVLCLFLAPAALAQDDNQQDVFATMEKAKAAADEFNQRNKPLVNAKIAQLNALNDYLLSAGVAYHAWNYQSWVLDIEERVVSGSPSCKGGSAMPGPCVGIRPGYNFPSSDTGVYVYGLIKGYASVAGGGVMAQPSVTGNAFTAILYEDQNRCLASTTVALWSEELRTKVLLPLNVLVDGTHTYFVSGKDIDALPEPTRKGFLERFEALGKL